MITKIEKSYARVVNVGNYETVRIEIRLEDTLPKECTLTPKEIVQRSEKLLALEKLIIENEAQKLISERKEEKNG